MWKHSSITFNKTVHCTLYGFVKCAEDKEEPAVSFMYPYRLACHHVTKFPHTSSKLFTTMHGTSKYALGPSCVLRPT